MPFPAIPHVSRPRAAAAVLADRARPPKQGLRLTGSINPNTPDQTMISSQHHDHSCRCTTTCECEIAPHANHIHRARHAPHPHAYLRHTDDRTIIPAMSAVRDSGEHHCWMETRKHTRRARAEEACEVGQLRASLATLHKPHPASTGDHHPPHITPSKQPFMENSRSCSTTNDAASNSHNQSS